MVRITYGAHALEMMAEREIERSWVERAVTAPESVEPDAIHPERRRAFCAIPERDGRVLRVVYVSSGEDAHIVTAFFDRSRRLPS